MRNILYFIGVVAVLFGCLQALAASRSPGGNGALGLLVVVSGVVALSGGAVVHGLERVEKVLLASMPRQPQWPPVGGPPMGQG